MKNFIPYPFRVQKAIDIIRSFTQNKYYLFTGGHVPNINDTIAADYVSSPDSRSNVFTNMIHGVQLQATDASILIPRVDWVSGTVYPNYVTNSTPICHVVVYSGPNYFVFKCLDNNNGAPSTVAPIGAGSSAIVSSDGYTWKYMFTIPAAAYVKFTTPLFVPFVANTVNQAAVVPGSVDVVRVASGGVGYNNWFIGQVRQGDIVSPTTINIVESAVAINSYYTGCIIKFTNPASPANGQTRRIVSYSTTAQTKTIVIDSPFTSNPIVNDTYEIYPGVTFKATNGLANVATARAIINPAQSNSVSRIDMLTIGANHRAATATVNADPSVTVTAPATIVPVVGPPEGHGGNPAVELGGTNVGFSTQFSPTITDVPSTNGFRTIGIIRNPKFENVVLTIPGTSFVAGEQVVQYQKIATLTANATLSGLSLTTDAAGKLLSTVRPDDLVLISNATTQIVTTIDTLSTDTAANTRTAAGNLANGTLTLLRVYADGVVVSSNTTAVFLTGANSSFTANGFVTGITSHVEQTSSAVSFNTKANTSTFVQTTKIIGIVVSGTLIQNEPITQGTASAIVHSIKDNLNSTFTVYATNVVGNFALGNVTGSTSGAVLNITAKYTGDLTLDQGQLVYIENIVPVTRSSNKTETISIVLGL